MQGLLYIIFLSLRMGICSLPFCLAKRSLMHARVRAFACLYRSSGAYACYSFVICNESLNVRDALEEDNRS